MRDPTEREILEVMDALLGFYSKELKRSDDPADKLTLRQVRLEAEKACRAFLSVAAAPPSSDQLANALKRIEYLERELAELQYVRNELILVIDRLNKEKKAAQSSTPAMQVTERLAERGSSALNPTAAWPFPNDVNYWRGRALKAEQQLGPLLAALDSRNKA